MPWRRRRARILRDGAAGRDERAGTGRPPPRRLVLRGPAPAPPCPGRGCGSAGRLRGSSGASRSVSGRGSCGTREGVRERGRPGAGSGCWEHPWNGSRSHGQPLPELCGIGSESFVGSAPRDAGGSPRTEMQEQRGGTEEPSGKGCGRAGRGVEGLLGGEDEGSARRGRRSPLERGAGAAWAGVCSGCARGVWLGSLAQGTPQTFPSPPPCESAQSRTEQSPWEVSSRALFTTGCCGSSLRSHLAFPWEAAGFARTPCERCTDCRGGEGSVTSGQVLLLHFPAGTAAAPSLAGMWHSQEWAVI